MTRPELISLFLRDFTVLLDESFLLASELPEDQEKRTSLLHRFHTLKGTAQMLPEAKTLAGMLHQLEEDLLAKKTDWQEIARKGISEVRAALGQFHEFTTRSDSPGDTQQTGLGFSISGNFWIELERVLKVLSADEVPLNNNLFCFQGVWIPVHRAFAASGIFRTGLILNLKEGVSLVLIDRVLGVVDLQKATQGNLQKLLSILQISDTN